MQVCFIGLGSIAKRHITNLKDIFGTEIFIDVLRSGCGKKVDEKVASMIRYFYSAFDELPNDYDAIFITNPSSKHYETLVSAIDKSNAFFIEKPVFDDEDRNIGIFKASGKLFYVACPLRYTAVIQYAKDNIDFSKVYSMRCISSSYLPDWRTGVDYRDTYSAHKSLGGGVSIDLIHEWDYIHYLVGKPTRVKSIISKKSNLEIDSDDIAIYLAEYEDKLLELHLDYFGRKAIRKMELFCADETIVFDLIEQKITWENLGKTLQFDQDRDDFQKKELIHFFKLLKTGQDSDNTLDEACDILKIAKGKEF